MNEYGSSSEDDWPGKEVEVRDGKANSVADDPVGGKNDLARAGPPSNASQCRGGSASRLRPWRKRFADQFIALCGKQVLVYWRNWLSTLLRVLSPLVFMFLLWLLDIAFRTDNQNLPAYLDNPSPSTDLPGPIPACGDDVFIKDPCYDFFFSPNTSESARQIVEGIRLNNPGRAIPEQSVIGFESIEAANAYLLANPERVPGGVHFRERLG